MKKIYATFSLLLMLIIALSIGCKKQELMMSEGKISEQLSHTWSKQFTPSETDITWEFKDGIVYARQNENISGQGTYKVDCSLTKAKIKIDGFTGGNDFMNVTWQIISLDNHILVITNMDKGTQEYEFTRVD